MNADPHNPDQPDDAGTPPASESAPTNPPPRAEESPAAPPGDTPGATPADAPVDMGNKRWYVVKVQSGREESIKEAIERRVKIEGLQDFFGEVIIPTEKVTEMRNNKRVTKERKLYPGYLMVNLEFNDKMLYLFRETSGVGDFVGGALNKPPPPMNDHEVARMKGQKGEKIVETKTKYEKGDKVKVKDGTFSGMEGEIKEVLEGKGAVRVELTIFGRQVPVDLEYWQVDYV
jgi:transcription termination/antitermination protein NusG